MPVQHVQFVIFDTLEHKKALFSQVVMSAYASNTRSENATKLVEIFPSTAAIEDLTLR